MNKLYTTDSDPILKTKNMKVIGWFKMLNIVINIKKDQTIWALRNRSEFFLPNP